MIVYPYVLKRVPSLTHRARRVTGVDAATIDTISQSAVSGNYGADFPSDDPGTVPRQDSGQKRTFRLPTAAEILRGRRERDATSIVTRPQTVSHPTGGEADRRTPSPSSIVEIVAGTIHQHHAGCALLKADVTDGASEKVWRTFTEGGHSHSLLMLCPIAAELRIQYAIGYYPTNKARTVVSQDQSATRARTSSCERVRVIVRRVRNHEL